MTQRVGARPGHRQTALLAQGGNTNKGAPSDNFALLPEYALSAAISDVDLDASGTRRTTCRPSTTSAQAGAADANDPFGGNNGKNQAKISRKPGAGLRARLPQPLRPGR